MAVLVLCSQSVSAGWVPVEKDYVDPGRQTVYLDPDAIIREESLVTVEKQGLHEEVGRMEEGRCLQAALLAMRPRLRFVATATPAAFL
ncbi:MAG: hypothetical protein HP490_07300 [Nitrospira sp.]|nr:hypothetical protein [Nitrospira sp.]